MHRQALVLATCFIVNIVEAQLRCGKWGRTEPLIRYTEAANEFGPGYDYYGAERCEYVIEPSQSSVYTVLKWKEFDIDDDMPNCYKNYVRISIGCGRNEVEVAKFCSRNSGKPFPIISRDGCIRIEVRADYISGGGFKAEYTTSFISYGLSLEHNECNTRRFTETETLSESSGLIASSNWPVGYNSEQITWKCEWKILPKPERPNIMLYVFDFSMNRQYALPCGLTSVTDFVGIRTASAYHYFEEICNLKEPRLYQFERSSIYLAFEVEERRDDTKGRGFVIGYMSYGTIKEETNSNYDTTDLDDDDGPALTTLTIVIIVVMCVFCCCGCVCGTCKYLLKDEEGETQNVELATIQESNRLEEPTPNSHHELPTHESSPMFNPEFSEVGPPSYANLSHASAKPSAPLFPPPVQPSVSNDDAPPPSYKDALKGDYRC